MLLEPTEIVDWAFKVGIVALFGNAWSVERKQHRQDLAIKDLELKAMNELALKTDLDKLIHTVNEIRIMVERIAAHQDIAPTRR